MHALSRGTKKKKLILFSPLPSLPFLMSLSIMHMPPDIPLLCLLPPSFSQKKDVCLCVCVCVDAKEATEARNTTLKKTHNTFLSLRRGYSAAEQHDRRRIKSHVRPSRRRGSPSATQHTLYLFLFLPRRTVDISCAASSSVFFFLLLLSISLSPPLRLFSFSARIAVRSESRGETESCEKRWKQC